MDMHLNRVIISLLCLIATITCYAQDIMRPDTCIDMTYYKSYSVIIRDTIRPSYCFYSTSSNLTYGTYKRNGMQFHGNTKHFNYAKSGYDKGHLVPAEDLTYSKESLESTFRWWNCVPQKASFNRGIWRKEELKIHSLEKKRNLDILVGACNYKDGIPKYCYKVVFDHSTRKIISIFIYDQESNQIPVTNKFIDTIKKIYYDCKKRK